MRNSQIHQKGIWINSLCCIRQQGYSVLQTSFALAVMAAFIAVLIPRFLDLLDDARDAKVKAVGSGFKAAVYLARESWYASNQPTGVLKNFGLGNLVLSVNGWPIGVAENYRNSPEEMLESHICQQIWTALLVEGAPVAVAESAAEPGSDTEAEFLAVAENGICRFHYLRGDGFRFIEYNPANGRIIWQVR